MEFWIWDFIYMSYNYRPVVLAILDGWGVAPDKDGNGITRAELPNFNNFLKNYPTMTLSASGAEVGLSFGEMGNSEVGHLNLGAGRVYYQTLPRINIEIKNDKFKENAALLAAIKHAKNNKTNLHLVGLVSNGNVHASLDHLLALLDLCAESKISKRVFVHAFLDGRDSIYNSGSYFIGELLKKIKAVSAGGIATLSGRYYAMDRDNHYDRVAKVWRAMVKGEAERSGDDPLKIISESYENKNYDEEFIPAVITKKGAPLAKVADGDAVIFFNFRPDRARELTKAFVLPDFNKFEREYLPNLFFVTMTDYEKDLPVVVAYPPVVVRNSISEIVSRAGLRQLHIAETEKYAHITFFFNGTVETPFAGEERVIIPSPKVPSYAEAPEMSAGEIAKTVVKSIEDDKYDFYAINFANADMVGHTGEMEATRIACETVDKCVGEIAEHVLAKGGAMVITADHGNAEELLNLQTGERDKEHSNNPVPLIIIAKEFMGQAGPAGDPPEGDLSLMAPVGVLSDVAPTVLNLLGLEKPEEMTGSALI